MQKRAFWQGGACAAAGLWLLAALTGFAPGVGMRFAWCVALPLAWWACKAFFMQTDHRLKGCFGTLGALFMCCTALGIRFEFVDETGLWGVLASAGVGACLAPAAGYAFISLQRLLCRLKAPATWRMKPTFWAVLALLLLCWLPVIVAFFPGITGYDMDFQIYQLNTGDYSTHHPLLHTLFVGAFYAPGRALGHPSLGYGLHTLAQTLLLACSIAYAMAWLAHIRCPRALLPGLTAFFALSPQHAVMAMSGTKDVLFAAAMLTAVVEMCRLFLEPERKQKIGVLIWNAALIAAACMLRNNALYGLALLWLIALTCFRRAVGKRVLATLLVGLVLAQGGMTGLKWATNARDGSVREMLSIPCQQLARVYARHGLQIPLGYELREVLPEVERYAPERADFVKASAKVTPNDRLARFMKLWAREAMHHPIEYIDAFLLTTKGFWYVDDLSFATTYNDIPGQPVGFLSLRDNPATGIASPARLPALRKLWGELFTHNGYQRLPILWQLMHPALYTWLLGFVLAWAVYRRHRAALFGGCVLASYLLTLLMGPCAIIRYQYDLMLAAPVLLALLCAHEQAEPSGAAC